MLTYKKLRFEITTLDEINLPYFKGSTFRGAFGVQFKKIVCALKTKDCNECILKEKCIYSYVFETSALNGISILGRVKSIPHPFVIEPPEDKRMLYKKGDNILFNLILFGKAIEYTPYFVYTFIELGKSGIGRGRGSFKLKNIYALENSNTEERIYSAETNALKKVSGDIINHSTILRAGINGRNKTDNNTNEINLRFVTPARIKYNRKLTIDLEFHVLIRQLLRRIYLLRYFHCNNDSNTHSIESNEINHKELIEKAREVVIKENNLKWYDWERYSNRQKTHMKLGGFVGEITYHGNLTGFLPFIKAGEILHIGKGTSFGLGKYRIVL